MNHIRDPSGIPQYPLSKQPLSTTAETALLAHLQIEDGAKQESALVTASDAWNGTPSGKTPYTDWQARKTALTNALSDRRQIFEESQSALRSVVAKYGLYEGAAEPPSKQISSVLDDDLS